MVTRVELDIVGIYALIPVVFIANLTATGVAEKESKKGTERLAKRKEGGQVKSTIRPIRTDH